MSMEKITKEELKNLIGGKALSDDELEKVSGGADHICLEGANYDYMLCIDIARNMYKTGGISYNDFSQRKEICKNIFEAGIAACG